MKRQRQIIASLSLLLLLVSSCLLLFMSCQTATEKAPYIYMVQSGDTLESIAKDSRLPADLIKDYNKLKFDQLNSGQILLLPGVRQLNQGCKIQKLNIVHRNIWGASKASKMNPAGKFNKITLHHTTEKKQSMKRNDLHFIQSIQKYHQKERQWADIAYHFIIGKDGTIYEGRLLHYRGAHVKNHNKGNIGIAILGDLNLNPLKKSQEKAISLLIEALREKYNIPEKELFAHRELGTTSCPGDHAMSFLKEFRD